MLLALSAMEFHGQLCQNMGPKFFRLFYQHLALTSMFNLWLRFIFILLYNLDLEGHESVYILLPQAREISI